MEPPKAEPREMFWGSNTFAIGVWMYGDLKRASYDPGGPGWVRDRNYTFVIWFLTHLFRGRKLPTYQGVRHSVPWTSQ